MREEISASAQGMVEEAVAAESGSTGERLTSQYEYIMEEVSVGDSCGWS